MTLKVFQNSYSVECLWIATSEGRIIFIINKLNLLLMPNFLALAIYFTFQTKSFWNKGIDTCFNNIVCMLLDSNFDFHGGYCWLLLVTKWLLFVTAGYHSLLLVPTFRMNDHWQITYMSHLMDFVRLIVCQNGG